MPDLRSRSDRPELMDGNDVSQEDFAACMADLSTVNTLTLARRPTLNFVSRALARSSGPLTIVDVGFGAGDMLRSIAAMLRRRDRQARLIGIDLNPRSEPVARAMTPPGLTIDWRTGDAFRLEPSDEPDLVISSLVTHHMDDAEIVRFLRWMEDTARQGWFVNDLHRHALAWHAFSGAAKLVRWHRFVQHDGPLSIARSFRRSDWDRLLAAADVRDEARVRWRFPFRYCVERQRW
jgi:2-polyprenyl-3-methyl-5-hydroxy-6-metoxy-1,4-benzoquinol methylase